MAEIEQADIKKMYDNLIGLSPNTRACAKVGIFLQIWALMETQLNHAVGKILSLNILQESIVTANIPFAAKANIVRSALKLSKQFALVSDRNLSESFESLTDGMFCRAH
jgi:hypothetical protein